MGESLDKFRGAAKTILNCAGDIGMMKKCVDEMYGEFLKFTNVNMSDQNDLAIILQNGKAISPSAAAHCLLEMKRTALFLRGISKAIALKLSEQKKVTILYAGCGPYATLITPLLSLLTNEDITVDLLDVNEISLNSARKVIEGFHLDRFVDDYLLEDAAVCKLKSEYDIVISETLMAGLRNEPFVSIIKNLTSQLKPDCIFIPHEVVIKLKIDDGGIWNPETLQADHINEIDLGEIFKVNRDTVSAPFTFPVISFDIPTGRGKPWSMKLYTTINVYDTIYLTDGDCSLNLPHRIDEFNEGESVELEIDYNMNHPVKFNIKKALKSAYIPNF